MVEIVKGGIGENGQGIMKTRIKWGEREMVRTIMDDKEKEEEGIKKRGGKGIRGR